MIYILGRWVHVRKIQVSSSADTIRMVERVCRATRGENAEEMVREAEKQGDKSCRDGERLEMFAVRDGQSWGGTIELSRIEACVERRSMRRMSESLQHEMVFPKSIFLYQALIRSLIHSLSISV